MDVSDTDLMAVFKLEEELQRLADYDRSLDALRRRLDDLITQNTMQMEDLNARIDTIVEKSWNDK